MPFRLPTAEEKADYVLQQFDRIAKRYDLTNDVISMGMHRLWKSKALDCLISDRKGSYLDVCCGTGDLALAICQRLMPEGQVTGLDFSLNMLAVAKERSRRALSSKTAAPRMEWVKGDALNLPFAADTFDGAVVSFGLRNLTDYGQGVAELARVVRSGGKVVNLDLGRPEGALFTPLYMFYFAKIVPLIGQILQGDLKAYTYLPQSMHAYPPPEGITVLFQEAGLKDIVHIPLASGSVALHCGTVK